MRIVILLTLFVFSGVACTTLEPVNMSAAELQEQLRTGALVTAGDRVRLVTADEAVHKFRVKKISVEQDMVLGKNAEVPIDQIVAVETSEVSVGRTAVLTGGVGIGVAALIAIAIAPAIILGGG
jgi:hypothetical protein